MIVVPIGQFDVVGNALDYAFGDMQTARIIFAVIGEAEEHIAPHMRLKAVFLGDLRHSVQVPDEKLRTVGKAVFVEIGAQPHHVRLVHADMDTAGGEISGGGSENFIEKFIGLFFVDQKDVRRVHNVAVNG